MSANKQSILCVDDDPDNLDLITYIFEEKGFEVTTCKSLKDCLPLIRQNDFTAVILDNWFVGGTSLEVCQKIRASDPTIPIIFYSAEVRENEIEKALEAGANVYLKKPDNFDKITETVNGLIRKSQAEV